MADIDIQKTIRSYIDRAERAEDYTSLVADTCDYDVFMNLSDYRSGLIRWYPFAPDSTALEVSPGMGALTGALCDRCGHVVTLSDDDSSEILRTRYSERDNLTISTDSVQSLDVSDKYDYIICVDVLEHIEDPVSYLRTLYSHLTESGMILVTFVNRYGFQYLAGRKTETGFSFDTIAGECPAFSRPDIVNILDSLGTDSYRFYYPVPDHLAPVAIYSDDFKPSSNIFERLNTYYPDDDTLVFDDHALYADAVAADAFTFLSNSFLVEICAPGAKCSDVDYVTLSTGRGRSASFATCLTEHGTVIKKCMFPESVPYAHKLVEENDRLIECGVPVIPMKFEEDALVMDRIDAPTLQQHMADMIAEGQDVTEFEALMDRLWNYIQQACSSTENISIELIPLNCFYHDNEFIFFDQEFHMDDCTPLYVLFRAIRNMYSFIEGIEEYYPIQTMKSRYGITDELYEEFMNRDNEFLRTVNVQAIPWTQRDLKRMRHNRMRLTDSRMLSSGKDEDQIQKKYNIGYVPGVFDLFHVGHLNLLINSKNNCRYLIAGVLTDEMVEFFKGHKPVIPYEERARIVGSTKYVDEVVAVDFHNTDKLTAWELYHYDCHFAGDDHEAAWVETKRQLREVGSDMVCFNYTQGTSSTMLRTKMSEPTDKGDGKYDKGLLIGIFDTMDVAEYRFITEYSDKCRNLIIGLMSDDLIWRLTDHPARYSYEDRADALMSLKGVSEVVKVDIDELDKKKLYDRIGYDVVFSGVEYGSKYQEDLEYLSDHSSTIQLSEHLDIVTSPDSALGYSIREASFIKSIVLFGTGRFFDRYMDVFGGQYPPEFAVDNDPNKWGTSKSGIEIRSPELIREHPDDYFVVVCVKDYFDITNQLMSYGVDYRTLYCDLSRAMMDEYESMLYEEAKSLDRNHKALTTLMKEFDRVCREHGLHYYMNCGSLIGTVRNEGIIPWDDDLDIAMPRKDFDAIKSIAADIWKNGDFLFLDYNELGKNTFLDLGSRLLYMKEYVHTELFTEVKKQVDPKLFGHAFLDIYILDDAPDSDLLHKINILGIKGCYGMGMVHRDTMDYSFYEDPKIRFFVRCLNLIGRFLSVSAISHIYERLRKRYNGKDAHRYFESNGFINNIHWTYDKELFGEGIDMPFEGLMVRVPDKYGEYLEAHGYHNYMTPPPAHTRKPKHISGAEKIR